MDSSDYQVLQYVPVLILAIVAVSFSVGMLVVSVVIGKRGRRTAVKDTAYECGMPPVDRRRADVGQVLPRGHAVYSV